MDKALKQRLVGAIVLVALAVLILPMLLDGPTDSPQEAKRIELPVRPQGNEFETRRFPIGEQTVDQPAELPTPQENRLRQIEAPETYQEVAPPTPAQVQLQPEERPDIDVANPVAQAVMESPQNPDASGPEPVTASPEASNPVADNAAEPASEQSARAEPAIVPNEPEPVPVTAPATTAAAPGGRYLVQVASFSSTGNANRLADQLKGLSMPVVLDTVQSDAGSLHRVRVGPFAERPAAEQALSRLNQQFADLNPRLVDLRPNDAAAVTRPSDPMVRWVVQVGSFSAADNADKLVFQMRDAGYRASSVRVTTSGQVTYKVRVGPEIQRESAVLLKERIAREMGITGLVMSAE